MLAAHSKISLPNEAPIESTCVPLADSIVPILPKIVQIRTSFTCLICHQRRRVECRSQFMRGKACAECESKWVARHQTIHGLLSAIVGSELFAALAIGLLMGLLGAEAMFVSLPSGLVALAWCGGLEAAPLAAVPSLSQIPLIRHYQQNSSRQPESSIGQSMPKSPKI